MLLELGLDLGAVPDQQEFDLAMPVKRDGGAWNDHGGADVAPHGVKRDANLAWHKKSWKPGLVRS